MAECFKCGIDDNKAVLMDVLSQNGIAKICRKCNEDEGLLIVGKPKEMFEPKKEKVFVPRELESKKGSVYERLSRLSGVGSREKESASESIVGNFESSEEEVFERSVERPRELLKGEETTLRDIVDKNYESKIPEERRVYEDLIDNFHWVVLRARRHKKLTQEQLAKEMAEPEAAVRLAEQGVLPEGYAGFVSKVETILGIKITKSPLYESSPISADYSGEDLSRMKVLDEFEDEVSFDDMTMKTLTISDLQEMKRKKDNEMMGLKEDEDFAREEKVEGKNPEDISKEDLDRLVFGK